MAKKTMTLLDHMLPEGLDKSRFPHAWHTSNADTDAVASVRKQRL